MGDKESIMNLIKDRELGARSSVDGWDAMLQAERSWVWVPMRSLIFLNLTKPYSRTMALLFTQPLTEMGTRRYVWGKVRPARKADNITAICEPIV
jgi:hypothetical protein